MTTYTNAQGRQFLNKKPKKRNNEEERIQTAFVNWFRIEYPQYHNLLTAIPNGGNRDAATGAMIKRTGTLAGWPDMQLMVPKQGKNGLFIEFKKTGGRISENQAIVLKALQDSGYKVCVVYSFLEAQSVVQYYLG